MSREVNWNIQFIYSIDNDNQLIMETNVTNFTYLAWNNFIQNNFSNNLSWTQLSSSQQSLTNSKENTRSEINLVEISHSFYRFISFFSLYSSFYLLRFSWFGFHSFWARSKLEAHEFNWEPKHIQETQLALMNLSPYNSRKPRSTL